MGVLVEMDGTWTTSLVAGWGAGWNSDGWLTSLNYPGIDRGFQFNQAPDFTLTLKLMERYYLEVIYSGTVDDRSFLVGYQGQGDEFLQWVKAGNASFSVPGRAGTTLAEGRQGAAAVGAGFHWGDIDAEVLARYEDGTRESRTFLGYREVSDSVVALDGWIRRRFFRLPGTYPLTGVHILVSDPSGTLGPSTDRFRTATSAEVAVDLATGEVRLASSATRRFLVTWDAAASSYAADDRGLSPEAYSDSSLSGNWYVLARPGADTPWELRNRYSVSKGTTGSIRLVSVDDGSTISGYPVTHSSAQDWFEVSGSEDGPFADDNRATLGGLYPNGGTPPATSTLPWEFRLPTTTSATSYQLGTDILSSSIIVTRNGVATTAFTYDSASGTLDMTIPVFDTDTVVISYQRTDSGNTASDLVLWQGGRWKLSDSQALEWNLQGQWNMSSEAYTTEDLESPGKITASALWTGTSGNWGWSVGGSAGAVLTDSTGHRRLYGWSTGGTVVTYSGDALRPSAAPASTALTLTNAKRGATLFRDYWTTDSVTGSVSLSAYGKSGIDAESWTSGGWMGPYLVRGDGTRTDRLAVAEAELTSGEWTGMEVFVDSGASMDLESTSSIEAIVRLIGGVEGDKVYLQAGTISENFDGTGAVRSVEYRTYPALKFLDEGTTRYFPIPDDSSWGNDGQDDGVAGIDGDLVTLDVTSNGFDEESDSWQTVRIALTDAQRQILAATTGWRLIVVGSSTGTRTILAGPVTFLGSAWTVSSSVPENSGTVNPSEEEDSSADSGYHIRVGWTDQQSWTVEGRNSAFRPAAYRKIHFQYKLTSAIDVTNSETLSSMPMQLKFADADGHALTVRWDASVSSSWQDAEIDLRSKELTVDGTQTGTVSSTGSSTSWDRLFVSQRNVDGSYKSGTFYLASMEATDAAWEPVATTTAKVTWKQAESWPSSQSPFVSGLTVEAESNQSGITEDQVSWIGQTNVSGTFGIVKASGEVSYEADATTNEGHGAYEATLPLGWTHGPTLELTDRFSDQGERSEQAKLSVPWVGTVSAKASAEGIPDTLEQAYSLNWVAPNEWPHGLSASWDTQWNQTQDTDDELTPFFQQWGQSWQWLNPAIDTAPYHLLQSTLTSQYLASPVGLRLNAKTDVSQTIGSSTTKWTPEGTWNLQFPVSLAGPPSLVITPSITKTVTAIYSGTTTRLPGQSAHDAWTTLANQQGGLFWLPFAEQYTDDPWSGSDLQTGTIESEAALSWERGTVSDWTDLTIPTAGTLGFASVRGADGSDRYRTGSLTAALSAQGLNLWGRLGSHPTLQWYDTDVWGWALSGTRTFGTRTSDEGADAAATIRSELVFRPKESLSLPITYKGHWGSSPTQTLGGKLTWTIRSPANLPFEFPRWLSPFDYRRMWIQTVTTALDVGWQPVTLPIVRNLQIIWKGRLTLTDNSEMSLTTQWGQQWQETVTVFGLQAELDLVLSF